MNNQINSYIKKVSKKIFESANGREIVSWGYAPDIFQLLENNDISIVHSFTGNQDLVNQGKCLHFSELDGKYNKYYVIFPLNIGLESIIPTLQRYGFKETEDFRTLCPTPEQWRVVGPCKSYTDDYGNSFENIPKGVTIENKGFANKVTWGNGCSVSRCNVIIQNSGNSLSFANKLKFSGYTSILCSDSGGSSVLEIHDDVRISEARFILHPHTMLYIGKRTSIGASCAFDLSADSIVNIGADCMLSQEIICHPADGHSIFDVNTERNINSTEKNKIKSINIGNHVWVGFRSFILGNTNIKEGSIIGAQSLVKGDFPNNVVIAGNPARVKREDVAWSRTFQAVEIESCNGYVNKTARGCKSYLKKEIAMQTLDEITHFDDYLKSLIKMKDNLIILVAVRDTPGLSFRKESSLLFRELGIQTDLSGKHGHSFLALIDKGVIKIDKISSSDENLEEYFNCDEIKVYLYSSVYSKTDHAEIKINGVSEAVDLRGINIVVYDIKVKAVIDSVCFDTHTIENFCYRKKDRLQAQQTINTRTLRLIRRTLDDEIRSLKNSVSELKEIINRETYKSQLMHWQMLRNNNEADIETKKRFFISLPHAEGVLRKIQLAGLILMIEFDRICRENSIKYWLHFGTLLGSVRHHGFVPWDDDTDVGMMREDVIKLKDVIKTSSDFILDDFFTVSNSSPGYMDHNYQIHFKNSNTPYCLDIYVYDYADILNDDIIDSICEAKNIMQKDSLSLMTKSKNVQRKLYKEYGDEFKELFNIYHKKQEEIIGEVNSKEYMIWSIDNHKYTPASRTNLPCTAVFPLSEVTFENHIFYAPKNPEAYANILYGNIYTIPDDILTHKHFHLSDKQIDILEDIIRDYGGSI